MSAEVTGKPPNPFSSGVLWMLAASAFFVGMTATVKVARAELSSLDTMVWRAAFALPVTTTLALWTAPGGWTRALHIVDKRALALRCGLGFCAMFSYFTAARGLSVADLTFVMRLQPALVAFLAPWLLGGGERVGRAVWVAGAIGLVGCGVLLGPKLEPSTWTLGAGGLAEAWPLWALGSTAFSAAAHTMLRRLGRSDRAPAVVFWFQAFCAVLAALLLLAGPGFAAVSARNWLALGAAGLCSAGGQLCMTRAYQRERAAVVSAAAAVGPLFAVGVDVVAFGLVPGAEVWVGGALIVAAGLGLLRAR
ncbi:MAG: hypothetical protein RIT45_394 [Pseudomonadota bacterium]|jgi:drug/metabolite transporter (DMT)-like permease